MADEHKDTILPTEEGIKNLSISSSSPNIDVVSFSVTLPDINGLDVEEGAKKTVVGTVSFMSKSALIWFGWGDVEDNLRKDHKCSVGMKGCPVMGPLVVAMPRKFQGFNGDEAETPCSQLISGSNDEEMMIGWQMASRLSRKIGWPIFVSCSLKRNTPMEGALERDTFDGLDSQRAAAFSERKVGLILTERISSLENKLKG